MSTLYVDTINEKTTNNGVYVPGHVVQVKQMTTSTKTNYTTSTYADSEFTLSITPNSTSSKILIMWASEATMTGDGDFDMRLMRDSTSVFTPFDGAANFGSGNQHGFGYSFTYLDSPATTSSITYTVQARENGSGTFKIPGEAGTGSLTLMEIGG